MKFFAATLLAVAAAAVKISQDDAELPPPPKCPPPPSEDAELEDIFDLIDADGSGDIDEDEGLAALFCAGEYGMIDDDDVDGVIKEFKKAAGEDGKVDMGEAKRAVEGTSSDEGDELAQKKQGPKPDGSGSDSGSDSGPDSEDLKAVADELDLDSEDVDALLDGEFAQKSGPGSGPGSEDLPSDLPSDWDMELAQKKGEGSGSGSGSGPDSEDLEALLDGELAQRSGPGSGPGSMDLPSDLDLDSEDEALLDGEFAQKSGPGPKDLPSDLDSDDLEALADAVGSDLDLAQEEGEGKKCPSKKEMEAVETDKIFDMVD